MLMQCLQAAGGTRTVRSPFLWALSPRAETGVETPRLPGDLLVVWAAVALSEMLGPPLPPTAVRASLPLDE